MPAEIGQQRPAIDQRPGVVRIDLERALEARQRLVVAVERLQQETAVAQRVRHPTDRRDSAWSRLASASSGRLSATSTSARPVRADTSFGATATARS